jgi:hypothetical protein
MPLARFERATPATKQPQTYALDCAATGIGLSISYYTSNTLGLCENTDLSVIEVLTCLYLLHKVKVLLLHP